MKFEAKLTKDKTSGKPSVKITSNAFDEVKDIKSATHLKLLGVDSFIEITDDLVIKRKKDYNGKSTDDVIHYSEIVNSRGGKEEYVCVRDGNEVAIVPTFYAQIVFMNKSEKGNFYQCDDGLFVHKDEIQIPAYRKIHLGDNATLEKPVHEREFYVQREMVVLPDGERITLPNDRVKQEGDKWLYQNNEGKWVKCYHKKGVDTREYVKHVLLDGEKIIDIQKLREKPNGDYVIDDENGEEISVGKREVSLKQSFVEGSTISPNNEIIIPHNILKQRPRIEQGNVNLAVVWKSPDVNGLVRVDVNRTRTKAVFTYADGHREIYAQHDVVITNLKPGDKEVRVHKLNIEDLGEDGVKIAFLQKKNAIAQNVEFKNGKLNSYTMNERTINDIKWRENAGWDEISAYTIDGVRVFDIEWHAGEVRACKLVLKDEEGNDYVEEVRDLRNSKYKDFAITYKLTEKIEDVRVENSKVSFKMGDYKFSDATMLPDGSIGNCKLRYDGKEEEINLSTDERFSQLKLAVKVGLDEQRIVPLIQSQLVEKKNGKYELVADVVQNEAMLDKNDIRKAKASGQYSPEQIAEMEKRVGVAKATNLENVSHAVKEQEKFKQKPFKTVVIDNQNKNKTHTISDFNTTYESASGFELDKSILPDVLGEVKAEVKKGEIKIDSKKADGLRDNSIVLGFALCSNPFTLVFGIPALIVGASVGIVAPMVRRAQKSSLKNRDVNEYKQQIQDNVAHKCQENINQLVANYQRELKAYKKLYSQKEFEEKAKELREKFKFSYKQEVGKLQMLGEGSIKCEFDASQKDKLTNDNYLGYLTYLEKCEELRNGKKPDPRFNEEMRKFNETEFDTPQAKALAEIELYKQFGGAWHKRSLLALQLQNIDALLEQENLARKNNGQKGIGQEDFVKQLRREHYESMATWGGIEDKLEAFKQTPEYLSADRKTQKELLKGKREALEGELTKVKVDNVQFAERVDKNGNSMVAKYTQSATAYMEYIDQNLAMGNFKGLKKFDLGFFDSLTAEQKEMYSSTSNLTEATAKKINKTINRRVAFDKAKNVKYVAKTDEKKNELNAKVDVLKNDCAKSVRFKDYEQAFKTLIAINAKAEEFKTDCEQIERMIASTPNAELNDETTRLLSDLDATRVEYAKQKKIAENAKRVFDKSYSDKVKQYALEEFAKTHKMEYAWYEKFLQQSSVKDAKMDDNSKYVAFYSQMCKNKDKTESYARELETYKVKHHVEDNINAEVFCQVNEEEFKKFIDERNAKSSGGMLDPNTEEAKCYYYAYCRRENPMRIDNFKRYFDKKVKAKAIEHLENGTLAKHEPKIIKSKGAKKSASASVAPIVANDATAIDTQSAGLTA